MRRNWRTVAAGLPIVILAIALIAYQGGSVPEAASSARADDTPQEPSAAVKGLMEALKDKDSEVAQERGRIAGASARGRRMRCPRWRRA